MSLSDQQLLEFKRELARVIQRSAVTLAPDQIKLVLEQYAEQLGMGLGDTASVVSEVLEEETGPASVDMRGSGGIFEQRWSLERTRLAHVLLSLVDRSGRGILELEGPAHRAQLLVEDGRLYEVQLWPASVQKSLGGQIETCGRLDAATLEGLWQTTRRHHVTEAQALLRRPDKIDRASLLDAIRGHLASRLVGLDAQDYTSARYDEIDSPRAGQTTLGAALAGLVFAYVRGVYRRDTARAQQRLTGVRLRRVLWPSIEVEALDLSIAERHLLDCLLAAPHSVETILDASALSRSAALGSMAAFEALGLITRDAPASSPRDSADWAREHQLDSREIAQMHERVGLADNAFAKLGLHWTSYDAEIERRYGRLRATIDDVNLPMGIGPGDRRTVKQIRTALSRAHRQIAEPDTRRDHRLAKVDAQRLQTVAAELDVLAGRAARMRKLTSALDLYQRLLELDPHHERASKILPKLVAHAGRH